MFHFDLEIIDITILDEGFSLSHLWQLRETLNAHIEKLEIERERAIDLRNVPNLKKIEKKIGCLQTNVSLIEDVMMAKENDIFEFLICQEFCLN